MPLAGAGADRFEEVFAAGSGGQVLPQILAGLF
jgi:hypothetical protein